MNPTKSSNRTEDANLLTAFVADRDERSFARIVEKYKGLVWTVCSRLLPNRPDAEDAFQNTFVLLATKASRIRKPKSLASWLYGTAHRTASSIRRKNQRVTMPLNDVNDPKGAEDVLVVVARKNESELVCAELLEMSDKFRAPLVLFYFVGETTTKIASELNLSVAAVESRLRRGRNALKSRLLQRGLSSLAIAAGLAAKPNICLANAIVPKTIEGCVAASAGNGWPFSDYLNSINSAGAKIMILKSIVAFGVTCMLGLGVAIHSTPVTHNDEVQLVASNDAIEMASLEIQQEKDDDSTVFSSLMAHLHFVFQHLHGVHNDHEIEGLERLMELHDNHGHGNHDSSDHVDGEDGHDGHDSDHQYNHNKDHDSSDLPPHEDHD